MDVELIKIPEDQARAKLIAYKRALARVAHTEAQKKVEREYEQIVVGYEAAAKGLPLIELTSAMRAGGWDELGRPRFAIARADTRRVRCYVNSTRTRFEAPSLRASSSRWQFVANQLAPRAPSMKEHWAIEAIVPIVPADQLPRVDADLSKRAILWEADWQEAPVDPMLLLPLGGDLYAVEATWDLTELERAIIAGRRES